MARVSTDLMTTEDICALYKVSRRTVYRWIERGTLKAVKVGKRLYFEPKDVEGLKQAVN